ncbi:small integral membrane protein 8 isoform X2 [Episyrphus balteatus]|nr:small integral membrane protein 8 isoform X2 [Episyrphus balteatus]XP_055843987.1 small integral membrane protein 8 isoform X2 [Episyrphus balteatus]
MPSNDNTKTNEKIDPAVRTAAPGDGVRSIKTTNVFRAINFELYAKPNVVVMGIGLTCITGVLGYIAYMRYKYEEAGYYAAVQEDGKEVFKKKQSKWDT